MIRPTRYDWLRDPRLLSIGFPIVLADGTYIHATWRTVQ
jgi:hypothetical protein